MNKQLTIKSYFTTCSLFVFLISMQVFSQSQEKPNVIVIYTDDQGAVDMGSYGSTDIYTPNMEKLQKKEHVLHKPMWPPLYVHLQEQPY